jgi:hypothetical protein
MNRKAEPVINPDDRQDAPDARRIPFFPMTYAMWQEHLAGSKRPIPVIGWALPPQRDPESPSSDADATTVAEDAA